MVLVVVIVVIVILIVVVVVVGVFWNRGKLCKGSILGIESVKWGDCF